MSKVEPNSAFPSALATAESTMIAERRTATRPAVEQEGEQHADEGQPIVGLALSGGGIRSATFALGILQTLAAAKRLRGFDYLSTVSGGGYIGSFLGALFARQTPAGVDPGATSTRAAHVETALSDLSGWLVRWLRENGRYLSPNGAGDTLLAGAVMLRNWVAVHSVLATLALTLFVGVDLVRSITPTWPPGATHELVPNGLVTPYFWWSPVFALPILVLVVWALPAGWAYWLVPPPARDVKRTWRDYLALATALGLSALQLVAISKGHRASNAGLLALQGSALVTTFATIVFFFLALLVCKGKSADMQHDLSAWLMSGLVVTVVFAVLALIDSLGQTVHIVLHEEGGLWRWLAPVPVAVGALATFGQKLLSFFRTDGGDKRPAVPLAVLATVAAVLIVGLELVSISAVGHAIAWKGERPNTSLTQGLFPPAKSREVDLSDDRHVVVSACPPEGQPTAAGSGKMDTRALAGAFALLLVVSWLIGRTRSFMNQSSLAPLYGARLRRAYLGASNLARERDAGHASVTRDVDGDELRFHEYRPWESGGPLHLVNVTLNETVSGQSQTEQRDRKGLPLAFGPAGVSVGVRHHAEWVTQKDDTPALRAAIDAPNAPRGEPGFQVFDPHAGPLFRPEPFTLSRLVAISGAAVSTGIGSRTSLGLSLLLGLLNLRLGHWWQSGIDPRKRLSADLYDLRKKFWSSLGQAFSLTFSVQGHLLDELTARFHGPARRNWNLSDGGHFENTGCYELIRRRVPLIVVTDDGADPDYLFEDFAQLVRKARLDFGATVRGASEAERAGLHWTVQGAFSDFDAIRGERERTGAEHEGRRWNKAHAALVIVEYPDTGQQSLVIWIKPTVTKSVPDDVLHYALENPDFPQEATSDQYFDEAQWESYRRLGEYIGQQIFGRGEDTEGGAGWLPRDLDPSGWKPSKDLSRAGLGEISAPMEAGSLAPSRRFHEGSKSG